jgi:uncharacterized protein YndB with AHSA1/START domain
MMCFKPSLRIVLSAEQELALKAMFLARGVPMLESATLFFPFSWSAATTSKGFEMEMVFHIKEINPQSYFSYSWIPFPMDQSFDYSQEEPTLVEFFLEQTTYGTLLKVKESGFNQITASRRAEAYKMHSGGWEAQLKNIEKFVVEK